MSRRAPQIAAVEALVFRAPAAEPVRTSFGTMPDRPMVLVRVSDDEGASGWGEVWCNFPGCGAEHRARLIRTVLAPMLLGEPCADPVSLWRQLSARTHVLALQSGESGPLAQAIAGIDIALWDLQARRAGLPLWRLLGGTDPVVRLYASGLNPTAPERLAARRRDEGFRAFKLKIGFGHERDGRNLAALREAVGDGCALMVDVNQGWDLPQALAGVEALADHRLGWIEEPLAADRPWAEWRQLAARTAAPLAGGENLLGAPAFEEAVRSETLKVVQPDVAKWGGISGCRPVAEAVRNAGLRYCPHCLGGGIALLASAHLLAAIGGDGLLEVDANDNPLRTLIAPAIRPDAEGCVRLDETPGLGTEPNLDELAAFAVGA